MTDTPSPSPLSPAPAPATPPVAPVAASPSTPPSPVTTPPTAARPEYIPESHWDATANKVRDDKALATHFNEILTRDAAEQSRRLSLPTKPEEYKAELPGDFKAPEGVEYKFNADDPLLAQARAIAHESGLSQEKFSKLLAVYAGSQVASQQAVQTARNAEIAKLGATGPAQIDALSTFYKGFLGEAEGKLVMSRIFTAADVTLHNKLVAKITQQGGAAFKGGGREPPPVPGVKSREEIAKMTPAQRLDYNQKFDQKSMPAWKDPRAA